MTMQQFKLTGQFYEVTVHFDNEQVTMPEAMMIEATRIKNCMIEKTSFVESKNRVIHEKKSVPATVSGRMI